MSKLSKTELRKGFIAEWSGVEGGQPGKIAEVLRQSECYKKACRVYCGPSPLLKQARINALLDGKDLVMPGPGMKEGFYRLKPYVVSFQKLSSAVTYKGLLRYGKRLDNPELKGLGIDLLIDFAQLVDRDGFFLGDGKGFFDLALAIFGETGALAGGYSVVVNVPSPRFFVEQLPRDPWDSQANFILSDTGMNFVVEKAKRPVIVWEGLEMDRIKRVTPLWKHYVATREKR